MADVGINKGTGSEVEKVYMGRENDGEYKGKGKKVRFRLKGNLYLGRIIKAVRAHLYRA